MPQQFFTNDFVGNSVPIQQNIRRAADSAGQVVQSGIQAAGMYKQAEQDQQLNMADYNQLKSFFEPTGVQADWNAMAPRPGETNEQYRARIKIDAMPLYDQLDQKGFDPREISTAAKIPGFTYDQLLKIRDKRIVQDYFKMANGGQPVPMTGQPAEKPVVMQKNALPEQARSARLSGGMTPTTELTSTYAGQTEFPGDRPEPVVAPPSNYSDRFDYAAQNNLLVNPNVAADLQKQSDIEVGNKYQPDISRASLGAEYASQGYPINSGAAKEILSATQTDKDTAMLAFRKYQEERKARGSDNSLLQTYLRNDMNKRQMALAYGKLGEAAAQRLYTLVEARQQLNADLSNAESYIPVPGKPAPDPSSIMRRMIELDNEIDRVRGNLPNFDRMVDEYTYSHNTINPIRVNPPGSITKNDRAPAPGPATNNKDPLGIR